jgi:starch-binding outer membrane protein, SusD/RagB family
VNQYMDLNEDGTPDVYFFTIAPPTAGRKPGVIYLNVTSGGFGLTANNQLTWRRDIAKHWADFKYLYPLPESALLTNPSLKQNPGWGNL